MTTQDTTIVQRAEVRLAKENAWQQFQGQTEFDKDMTVCLKTIGDKVFPTSTKNSGIYQEAMVKSLTQTINQEVGILDFWKALGKAKCKKVTIEDGHMNFYDDKAEKIDITSFTQPIEFPANSSIYDQRMLEREQHIIEAKEQLEQLLSEIQK